MADAVPRSDDDDVKELVAAFGESADYLSQYHEAFEDNYRFAFKQEQYDDDNSNVRDRRRIKPRGRQLASKIRHVVAVTAKQLRGLSTRPVDSITDPETAEYARWFMEYERAYCGNRTRRVVYRALQLAVGAGMGVLGLDVRYDLGPYPRVRPRLVDPRCLTWTPGWTDPEDETCPEVFEEFWETPTAIAANKNYGWKNTEGIEGGGGGDGTSARPTPLRRVGQGGSPTPSATGQAQGGLVRLIKRYRRFDSTRQSKDESAPLAPADRYMVCPTCGYADHAGDGATLPEVGNPCPMCQQAQAPDAPMRRVNHASAVESALAYGQGRRCTIAAPDVPGGARILWDGGWPYGVNGRPPRNVPYQTLRRYELPLEPWPMCDTELDWSYQTISNAAWRRSYEFISRAGGILVVGGSGLMDWTGKKPFEVTDKPISLARWMGMGAPSVDYIQPRNMLADLLPFSQAVDQIFKADQGIADLGLTQQNSKDIAASTVSQLMSSGEIPQDDFADRVAQDLGDWYSVWYDMARGVMTEQQLVGLRPDDGAVIFERLRGEQLPAADVLVEVAPNWREFDAERIDAVTKIASAPPELIPLLAEVANLPPSIVAKVMKAKMAMPLPEMPGAPAGAPPPGAAPSVAGAVPAQ